MKRRTCSNKNAGTTVATPLGTVGVSFSGKGITEIELPQAGKGRRGGQVAAICGPSVERKAAKLLRKYFSGKRVTFDVPLDLQQATAFQRAVWKAAAAIPYGETRSYAWIARRIGRPKAARAVGQALGANPVPVIIPCHRVISSSGALGGFSGGLGMKERLLRLERRGPGHARDAGNNDRF
jgi:methylated-DNA-[protein]-cysteine S-methyltransferase